MNYNVIFHFPKELLIYDRFTKQDNEAFILMKK